jgi:hypothetical protein
MTRMNWIESAYVTGNAGILAIFYTVLGAIISYVMYHIFDDFDEDWKKRPLWFKLLDVCVEVAVLSITAFWSAHIIEIAPPFFRVRKELDLLVDGYLSGIFYIYAVFMFLDSLTEKFKYLFDEILAVHFNKIFPQYGSILDLSLSYQKPKTEKKTSEF